MSTAPPTSITPSRPPAWRKPVVISSIVLGVLGVAVVVLYFLNVLMPRYTCDSTSGNCVGKYNGAYKTNTCNNKCTGTGGGTSSSGGYGYDCDGKGSCVKVAGGGFFGNDPGCGAGCYRCDEDNLEGGAVFAPKTSATMKKLEDYYYVSKDTTGKCEMMYTCKFGQCMITHPTLGQFKDKTCGKGCNVCKEGKCTPVPSGTMGGDIASCSKNTDCGGPYACIADKDGKKTCQKSTEGEYEMLKDCLCDVPPIPHLLTELNKFDGKYSKSGNDGGNVLYNLFVKLGEFTVSSDNVCTVTIDASYNVGIYNGSGSDSMIASLFIIDKTRLTDGQYGLTFNKDDHDNTSASTTNNDEAHNFMQSAFVIGGHRPDSMNINSSGFNKIQRDNKNHLVQLKGDYHLASGFYWIVAYLGIATNDTVKVTPVDGCNVSVPGVCK